MQAKRMKNRLSSRLLMAFLAIGVLAALVAGSWVEKGLKSGLMRWNEAEMTAEAHIIALMDPEAIVRQTADLAARTDARLTLIDAAGRVLADSDRRAADPDDHLHRLEIQEARLKGKGTAVRYSHTLKEEVLYVAFPLGDQGPPKGYIRLARPVRDVVRSGEPFRQTFGWGLFLTLFFSLAVALILSVRTLSPIRKLAAFTERAKSGSLSGSLRVESRNEIGDLAANINAMVAVLQQKIRNADEESRKLRSVFAGMVEGVVVLDARGRIETLNRGMEETVGCPPGELTGRTLLEGFRNIPLHDALERFRRTGETVFQEITLGDDHPVVMDVTISAVQGKAGGEGKTLLVFHDVTRLKTLERIRTDFVANVNHEIRTPLTAIIGFVETLEQGALEDRGKTLKFLGTIRENAERLNRLVDDLLTLSGIELGEGNLHPEALSLEAAIGQVLSLVAARISEKDLKLLREIPEGLPPIRADRDRLAQILLNILDNAVKFTPAGGSIAVTVSPGEAGTLTVRIADTGVGIPKGEIPRLGERFYRADKTRSREMGGTGLGLSIVKHLMMAHRGRMAIDSTLGHGTTVALHFPISEESK
jgi:two-component system phosphate regulon sensor histidine kinase PhoR